MPQGQLEEGLQHLRVVSAVFCGSASFSPTTISCRHILTSFLPPTSRYGNRRQRHWPSWNQCWLGLGSLGLDSMKRLFKSFISALRRKGVGEYDREGERIETRVSILRSFRRSFQLQSDLTERSRVQMALSVCPDTRQVCGTFKLPHQLVFG